MSLTLMLLAPVPAWLIIFWFHKPTHMMGGMITLVRIG